MYTIYYTDFSYLKLKMVVDIYWGILSSFAASEKIQNQMILYFLWWARRDLNPYDPKVTRF